MKICFITYGCKVNQAEAQKWEKYLKKVGYEVTNVQEEADCWIINTCAVTHKAEIQSRQIINKAKKLGIKAIVTGCYVELNKNLNEDSIKFIPNFEKDNLIKYFKSLTKSNNLNLSRHRAIIKIQDGCNNFCSYCIVPYLRGKPRSVTVNEIINEIKDYESMGIKEVILSGINLGLYGIDFGKKFSLNDLILKILTDTSIPKIRLSSIEINHIDDELLKILKNSRVCKHLHIPLQHGSDRILSLMNRRYTSGQYLETIKKIYKMFPDISIGTDVIVGFPSESEDDFNKTIKLIEKIKFSYLHVFTYSKRPLTNSSEFPEHISQEIKKKRSEYLIEISKRKKTEYIRKFVNKKIEVIIEREKNGLFSGTSDNYIKCLFKGKNLETGNIVNIKVTGIENEQALGKVIN
jgi:MiaB-like tRNA modifying enzyme